MLGSDATISNLAKSATTIAACCALLMATWPLRHLEGRRRKIALLPVGIAAALLPALQSAAGLWPRIVVCLTCTVMATKLIDLHVAAEYWQRQRFRDWLAYLVFPYIL